MENCPICVWAREDQTYKGLTAGLSPETILAERMCAAYVMGYFRMKLCEAHSVRVDNHAKIVACLGEPGATPSAESEDLISKIKAGSK